MNRTTIRAAVVTVICLAASSVAEAGLIGSYDWVAYNNSTAGTPAFSPVGPTVPNVTDYSFDTVFGGGTTLYSGGVAVPGNVASLVRFDNGADTGVGYTAPIGPTSTWHGAANRSSWGSPLVPGTVAHDNFGDIVGTNYELNGGFQNDNGVSTQTLTFTNLDPTKKYTFAAISTQIEWAERGTGGVSKVTLVNSDVTGGFANNTTQSPFLSVGGVAGGDYKIISASTSLGFNLPALTEQWSLVNANLGTDAINYAFLSGHSDDMIRFDDIMPGDDGTFSITTLTFMSGRLENPSDNTLAGSNESIGIDFFALGQLSDDEGGGEDPQTSAVPEPGAFGMGWMGLLALSLYGWRRRSGK